MAIVRYTIHNFSKEDADTGALCICIDKNYEGETIDSNAKTEGVPPLPLFFGAGIPLHKDQKFYLTAKSVTYVFDEYGKPINSAARNKVLKLATVPIETNVGNVVVTHNTAEFTRSSEGDISDVEESEYIENDAPTVMVDSLNVRDHFAIHALNSIIKKLDKDPATLDENAVNHYCQQAYLWAANMMTEAANARAEMTQDGTASLITKPLPIGKLETNSDKLLNNIIYALERTDFEEDDPDAPEPAEGEETKKLYSERVINPRINNKLKEFLRATTDSEDDTKIEPLVYEDPAEEEEGIKFWEYEALVKLLRRTQAKLTSPTQEDYQDGNKPVFLDRILIPELRGSLKRTSNPKDTSTTYIRAEEFLYPYKEFLKHQSGVGEIGNDFAAFEDLTKMLQNLQETLDSKKYQRVVLYKWEDFKTVLTDIKTNLNTINTTLTTLNTTLTNAFATQHQDMQAINNSLQAFTTVIDTRLSNIQSTVDGLQADVTDIKSNYATGSEIENAKDEIIDAMPTCKYNPPTD